MKTSSNTRFSRHLANCKRRKIDNKLSLEDFNNLVPSACAYCGQPSFGIDRVFNQFPYTIENSVPCCKDCNFMKRDYTSNFFLLHVSRVNMYNHTLVIEKFNKILEKLNSDF